MNVKNRTKRSRESVDKFNHCIQKLERLKSCVKLTVRGVVGNGFSLIPNLESIAHFAQW